MHTRALARTGSRIWSMQELIMHHLPNRHHQPWLLRFQLEFSSRCLPQKRIEGKIWCMMGIGGSRGKSIPLPTFKTEAPRKAGRLSWLAQPDSVALPAGPEFESHQKRISECWERKKNPSLCSPQGLALSGMGQGSGGFSTRLVFLLMKKRWGPFHTPG